MKVAVFDIHSFERPTLTAAAERGGFELVFIESRLRPSTAVLAKGCEVACIFVNDDASAASLGALSEVGVSSLALRCAGYNHVDLDAARELGLAVAHVPEYSPYAVAEHTVAMMLALNRKVVRANSRIRELNFALDGLVGFDMNGKTAGIVGMGKIGEIVCKILHGFGCQIVATDLNPNEELISKYGVSYVSLDELCKQSDVITLHAPLVEATWHMINAERLSSMKKGAMLINTSRGGLIDTAAVIDSLKQGHLGYLGIDVYEEESGLFFEDHSAQDWLQDEVISRLMTFKNVLITSHQAFLTKTALENIADTTMESVGAWAAGDVSDYEL